MFLQNTIFTKRTYLMNCFASKGVMKETGKAYDSTTLWLMTPQKNPGGTTGLGYESIKWGLSDNFDRIKHLNLLSTGPIEVEVELEEQTQGSGKDQKKVTICHNLRLISLTDAAKDPLAAGSSKKAS